jgi:OmpA family
VQFGRLAEHEPARLGRLIRIQAQLRQATQQLLDGGVGLEAREVHPDADVRAVRERHVPVRVHAPDVEAVGVREHRRVAVGAGDRDAHELAAADRRARELDIGGRVGVKILIVGHTDQPASDEYNYRLSWRRAENVRRALKDLFGPRGNILQIDLDSKTNVQVMWLGELHATLANMFNWGPGTLGPKVKNATYRRVDLIIDAQLVATFRGHP